MGGPSWTGVNGPLQAFEAGFAAELSRLGYGQKTLLLQLRLMGELSVWMEAVGIGLVGLGVSMAERFMADRRAAGVERHVTVKSLGALLGYLASVGVVAEVEVPVLVGVDLVLAGFARYLRCERGLGAGTIAGYLAAVRPFVAGRCRGDSVDLEGLTAADVTEFITTACPGRAKGPAKLIVSAMRSLLGWLHLEGTLAVPLAAAVPSVASRRLVSLPEPLTVAEVHRLLVACDRRSRVGRRDYAMVMLLWRLGLRAGEVSRLGLDDIDWRAGELTVAGKGPKVERLPLPSDVGEAVVGWLQRGRPATAQGRSVFVRVMAPHRQLSATGVTQAIFAAGRHAGLGTVRAHRLRHSAASAMLASGAALPEIGQVLRHRRALTTSIYAKVDVGALRHVAAPWPGVTQ